MTIRLMTRSAARPIAALLLLLTPLAAVADAPRDARRGVVPPQMRGEDIRGEQMHGEDMGGDRMSAERGRETSTLPPVRLLTATTREDDTPALRLDSDALIQLRAVRGRVMVDGVTLPDGTGRSRTLSMERFAVATPGVHIVVGAGERRSSFDPSRMVHLRGHVVGEPSSRVYLALADLDGEAAVLGQFQVGSARWVLGGTDSERRGLGRGDLAIVAGDGFGAPPLVAPCGAACCVPSAERDAAMVLPEGGVAGYGPTQRRLVRMAVETDHEYFNIFGDEEEAAAYMLALMGAVSDLYIRDFDAAVGVSFLRIWDQEEGLYNDPDPLVPFRNHWNDNMTHVERDVAHLMTGRRNLPYGGVAWLSSLCSSNAYAVNGYLTGSFASATDPAGGNWDLVVVAHELGHNCGTLHTHDYGIDDCAFGGVRRGGIMSYCHIVSGGVSNIDMEFDEFIRLIVRGYLGTTGCLWIDCDGNGVDDALDIMMGTHDDLNGDGIPDICQDCTGSGILDPIEIAMGLVADLDGNGIPDICEPDCNGNGIPDALDIAVGTSLDLNGNGIPDECEADCDGDGVLDWVQIVQNMSLDIDRDGILDACQDCDGDGVPDHIQLAGALNLWASGSGPGVGPQLRQFHVRSGVPARDASTGALAEIETLDDLLLAPDGALLATVGGSIGEGRIVAFDAVSGEFLGIRVSTLAGLGTPGTMLATSDGTMLVTSVSGGRVVEHDMVTGAFVRVVVPSGGGVTSPFGMAMHPDGSLLVGSLGGSVQRFEMPSGAHLGTFIAVGSGGLGTPRGLLTLPDGTLLVASNAPSALLRYDENGAFLGRFDIGANTNSVWGLRDPWCLRLADDGARLYVTSRSGSTSVQTYAWPGGHFLRSYYVLGADLAATRGLVQMPRSPLDCNGNGILDSCDIASGFSLDLNGNGIPDECETAPSADLNGDGVVDGADLGILLNNWGGSGVGDLNGDGTIDGADLGILLNAWTV